MTNKEIAIAIVNKSINFAEFIKSENLSKETVREINSLVKGIKSENKRNAFKAENFTLEYKGITMAFNPCVNTEKELVIFNNLSRDSYVVCTNHENKVSVIVLPRLSSKSNNYEWNKSMAKGNARKCIDLLETVTSTMAWDEFYTICMGFAPREIKLTGSLKEKFAPAPKKTVKKSSKKSVKATKKSSKKSVKKSA